MRQLRPRRRINTGTAVAAAMLVLASGCGSWNLNPGVLVQSVPLDLAFGRDLSETPAPEETPQPADEATVEQIRSLPIMQQLFNPPVLLPARELCPEADPLLTYPDPALAHSTPSDSVRPLEGNYLMKVDKFLIRTDAGEVDAAQEARQERSLRPNEPLAVIRHIQTRKPETTPKRGFSYGVTDPVRFSEVRFFSSAEGEDPVGPPGFYFQEFTFFRVGGETAGQRITVRPPNPLLIMDYPVKYGYSSDARVQEVEVFFDDRNPIGPVGRPGVQQKDSTVASAPGQSAPAPAAGTVLTSEATVLPNDQNVDRLFGCGEAVDAFRVRWKLTLSGQYNATFSGVHWFAPQHGGYPFKEEVEFASDVWRSEGIRSLSFAQSFMFVDPVRSR